MSYLWSWSPKPDLEQISVHLESGNKVSVKLKLDDSLPIIREKLASNTEIKMDEKLLFYSEEKGIISSESEGEYKLREIVNKQCVLVLKIKLWKSLNEKFSLDHGCRAIDDKILRTEKRAFRMTDCNVSIFPRPKRLEVKNINKDHQTAKKSLSAKVDPGIISLSFTGNQGNGTESNSLDETIYYSKSCLEFKDYLEPTNEFIEEVKDIKHSKTFKEIIEKYGQFIPTKISMGGKISKKEGGISKNQSKGISAKADFNKVGGEMSSSGLNESSSRHEKVSCDGIGKNDDEQSWNESLNDEKNWTCIGYENWTNIFELLTNNPKYNDLREKIFSAIGQRILYSDIEICDYTLNGPKPYVGKFKTIPKKILKRDDYYVFAVILDEKGKKDDFFTCQICFQEGTPMYIIHCIQIERQMFFNFPYFLTETIDECKLKIKYMIVGNYTDFNSIKYDELNSDIQLKVIKSDFNNDQTNCSNKEQFGFKSHPFIHFIGIPVLKDLNLENPIIGHHFYTDQNNDVGVFTFSYRLDQKKYVNLPNFSFHTLKISNVNNIHQFPYKNICKKYNEITHPEYFSLHSESVFGPIFFIYTNNEIKLAEVDCKCRNCGVCKNSKKISKEKFNFRYVNLLT